MKLIVVSVFVGENHPAESFELVSIPTFEVVGADIDFIGIG
jgi:hypothetical protein